jgi:aminopeptidase N
MKHLLSCALLLVLPLTASAQSTFPVRDAGEGPDRAFDVRHYRIEVGFDETKKMVSGTTTITLVPFAPTLSTIALDAEKMDVASVTLGGTSLKFEVTPKKLLISLNRSYSYRDTLSLAIRYSCTPTRGLYFTQPDSGYPDKPWQIWSQGEDMDNHFWFPCHDFPNDFATSEVIATVKNTYQALSNGRLLSVKEDKAKKTRTFHWSQEIPHASYLITLAAGEYAVLKDKAGNVPLEYWVYPRHVEDAKVCFARTPEMVRWFGEITGYPYPWAKYAQVLIKDFIVGGMENTSATSLADESTVYDARARVDDSPNSLIAHELAHQWWGDAVTAKDWRHLWLNESFASYFDPLWFEHDLGRDEFDVIMYNAQQAGITSDKTQGRRPIVSVGSFGANIYPRGASVLHMLRFVLGDNLFWRGIHHYITKHQHTPVETNDLKVAFEEATGQNLYWFFDEWVYKAGYPVFDLSTAWNDSAKTVALTVRQTQKTDSLTGVFRMPVDVEVRMSEGKQTYRVNILSQDTTFVLPARARPSLVIFDRGNWLLKEMHWTRTLAEWNEQAEHAENPVDRMRAIQELAARKDNAAHAALLARLATGDPFWTVRRDAINALDRVDSADEAGKRLIAEALVKASAEMKSAVRQAAVSQLRKYRGDNVIAALHAALKDSSYRVVANALRSLAKADSAHAAPVILAHLDMPSHGNVIASAALASLPSVDTVAALRTALTRANYGQPPAVRMAAFGILSRYGRGNSDAQKLYASVLGERRFFMRGQAVRWLGDNGDASVLPALQKLVDANEERLVEPAKAAIEKIRKRTEKQ